MAKKRAKRDAIRGRHRYDRARSANLLIMKFCPICAAVSGTWLVLSAGVAWGFLTPSAWLIPVALLMGGSVIGIANKMENHKKLIIVLGMPIAYLLVTN